MSILYITYDGILEPLGESQVLQYLRHLASDFRIVLISYEKPGDWADRDRRERAQALVQQARHSEVQDRITEEFEALVMVAREAAVRQRALEQLRFAKAVLQRFLQLGELAIHACPGAIWIGRRT